MEDRKNDLVLYMYICIHIKRFASTFASHLFFFIIRNRITENNFPSYITRGEHPGTAVESARPTGNVGSALTHPDNIVSNIFIKIRITYRKPKRTRTSNIAEQHGFTRTCPIIMHYSYWPKLIFVELTDKTNVLNKNKTQFSRAPSTELFFYKNKIYFWTSCCKKVVWKLINIHSVCSENGLPDTRLSR